MELKVNSLRDKLLSKEFVVGTFLEIPSPQLVEVFGLAGFDFVIIDGEHGSVGLERMEDLIRASLSTEISAMVRVPTCDEVSVRRPLDMGASGVHIPQITSASMASNAVKWSKYFPLGERGLQPFVRSASYGNHAATDYVATMNEETLVVLHIEGEDGISALDEILEVEGVDVLFIGPYDLSQSLGVPGQVRHPRVQEKMKLVVRKVKAAGKSVGSFCENAETAKPWRDLGVSYLAVGVDAHLLLHSARDTVSRLTEQTN